MPSAKHAVVIFNPLSGAHRKRDRKSEVEAYARKLKTLGIDAEPWPTPGPNTAADLARRAISTGVDLVIGSGGDGTLNELLQGMVGGSVPLAIWPSGTANVLAHDLEIPIRPDRNAAYVAEGESRRVSVGKANDRYFFLMAGIGLDAAMVRSVNPRWKKSLGEGAYLLSGLRHLVLRPEPFFIEVEGVTYESSFAVVGKSHGYGGGFSVTPRASIFEPDFEVSIFPKKHFGFEYLPNALASFFSKPNLLGNVTTLRTRTVTARSESETWVQVDGELFAPLPMTFEVVPDSLSLIVPKTV